MSKDKLLCRLADLNCRLKELMESDAVCRGWIRLTEDEIRYAIPEYFRSIYDVERAIDLVVQDLNCRYGIELSQVQGEYIQDEVCTPPDEQINLFDLYLSTPEPLIAA